MFVYIIRTISTYIIQPVNAIDNGLQNCGGPRLTAADNYLQQKKNLFFADIAIEGIKEKGSM